MYTSWGHRVCWCTCGVSAAGGSVCQCRCCSLLVWGPFCSHQNHPDDRNRHGQRIKLTPSYASNVRAGKNKTKQNKKNKHTHSSYRACTDLCESDRACCVSAWKKKKKKLKKKTAHVWAHNYRRAPVSRSGKPKRKERRWPCCYGNPCWGRHLSACVHVSVLVCECVYLTAMCTWRTAEAEIRIKK